MSRTYNPLLRRLPADSEITEPFYRWLPQTSARQLHDPVARIDTVAHYLVPVLPEITDTLFTRMTNQTGENTLQNMGKAFFLPDHRLEGTSRIHSLHRRTVIEKHIHPRIDQQFRAIYDSEGLSTEERLERLGLIAGTVIAQTQGYHDGNKRIARSVYDFIKEGPAGISAQRIFSTVASFSSSVDTERTILTQNSANIIQGAHEPGVYIGEEDVVVGPETTSLLSQARETLAYMRDNADMLDRYKENRNMYIAYYLSVIHRDLPEELRKEVMSVLHQREYGAAALACVYVDRLGQMRLPLDIDDAQELNDIDTELLTMRAISLIRRIAAGSTSEVSAVRDESQQGIPAA